MRLRNTTDIHDELVRAIIRAVRPAGIQRFDVMLRNSSTGQTSGFAYSFGCSYHDRRLVPLVTVRLSRLDGPTSIPAGRLKARSTGKGYLPHLTLDRKEALISILAHELRHLWQAKHRRGRVWGARGRFSERDADAWAIKMLRRHRRGELLLCKSAF